MQKRWLIKESGETGIVNKLMADLGVDKNIANILSQRGINSFEEAKKFFRPSLADLHDPFLMQDMDKAVDRLSSAIDNNEKVLVYGDYDVDGTTSVALMYSFLKKIHSAIDFYIPDRYAEGYGISFKGIDYAAETGVKLIIALDCGIKSLDKVEYATKKGIDFSIWTLLL
jgi:single-stranded-DNA-specific exonuclease